MQYKIYKDYDILGLDNVLFMVHLFKSLGVEMIDEKEETTFRFSVPHHYTLYRKDTDLIQDSLDRRGIHISAFKMYLDPKRRNSLNNLIRRVLAEYIAYIYLYRNMKKVDPLYLPSKSDVVGFLNNFNIVFAYNLRRDETWSYRKFQSRF